MSKPRSRAVAVLVILLGLLGAVAPSAARAADPMRPDPGRPWFGPHLPYPDDTPAAYVDRLGGLEASTYTLPIPYPLDTGAISQLTQYAELVAERGAVLVVDVQPGTRLQRLDAPEVADEMATELAKLHDAFGSHVLLRFAPEMNGSWETWGQQPGAYVKAFRTLAEAMTAVEGREPTGSTGAGDWSEMVWAPVYGSGYPYRRPDLEGGAQGALEEILRSERARADTNGDGELDTDDDPYAPYYPGDEWVDWVGLSMYRLGQSQGVRRNEVPPATEFRRRLEETWGYGVGGGLGSFYDRFAVGHDRPMLVETAAFFNGEDPGPRALPVKRGWWTQVFAAIEDYPRIAGISWLELARTEPEALQDDPVDWRVTARPRLARAFAADLADAPLTLGPVLDPYVAPPGGADGSDDTEGAGSAPANAPAAAPLPESDADHGPLWLLGAAVLLLLALALGLVAPGLRHTRLTDRDERIDLLRGGLGVGVLATVVLVTGLGTVARVDPLLVAAGVGLVLLVSGLAHGVRFGVLAATTSPWAAGVTRVRRARTVYVVAVATAVLALLLDAMPGVATDLGTYADARRLLDYPPPGFAVRDLLTLEAAPWLVGTLGLVAALVLVSPLLLALLHRGWWWAPLGLSWAAYAVWVGTGAEVLPLASEATLPVLLWQLPFVHGLVLGHRRASVERRGALAAGIAATAVVAYAGLVAAGVVTAEVPELAVVGALGAALLVLVTTCWRPVRLFLGWLLLPVGRHALVVVPLAVVAVVVLDVATR